MDVRSILAGAIDLYVHAAPDILPRLGDDLAVAREAKDAGLSAVVNRHHYSSTVERATLATRMTSFTMLGAVLLNDSVGGINPDTVDYAMRMGGRWIGMPTMGARHYRAMLSHYPPDLQRMFGGFGSGGLVVVDSAGSLLPPVEEILGIAGSHNAVLNLGYIGFDESLAVVSAAARFGLRKIVLTNVLETMRYSLNQADSLTTVPGTYLELTAHTMHPVMAIHGPTDVAGGAPAVERSLALIRRYGVHRCVLSSDGGLAGAPGPVEMLTYGVRELARAGVSPKDLRTLVYDNPARLMDS